MITWIEKRNIFDLPGVTNYMHGCNCAGAMGKGIAIQFKNRYPAMYQTYKRMCSSGEFSLGSVYMFHHGAGFVFNLGTQKTWRHKATLEAIEVSLFSMCRKANEVGIRRIALPRIDAGLGGLNWKDFKKTFTRVAGNDMSIELLVVENFGG